MAAGTVKMIICTALEFPLPEFTLDEAGAVFRIAEGVGKVQDDHIYLVNVVGGDIEMRLLDIHLLEGQSSSIPDSFPIVSF